MQPADVRKREREREADGQELETMETMKQSKHMNEGQLNVTITSRLKIPRVSVNVPSYSVMKQNVTESLCSPTGSLPCIVH